MKRIALPAPVEAAPEFAFNDQKVRVVMIEGAPWFSATDVMRCLGLNVEGGSASTLRPLGPDEKRLLRKRDGTVPSCGFAFPKQASTASVISESGLYKMVMRSDKPEAKAFQDWVTREVLPAY